MNRTEIYNKLHFYLGLLIAFTLPFGKLTSFFVGLLLINWILEGKFINKIKKIYKNRYVWLFISLYLIHIIGLLHTINYKVALFDLEVKLSLLIFPIVIASKPYSHKNLSYFMKSFIVGLVYTSLYMLSRSISLYLTNGENTFFYQSFAVFIHPSYFSMYINFAICWLFILLLKKDSKLTLISKFIVISFIIFFGIIILLLSSKSGLVTFLLITVGFLFKLIFSKKKYAALIGGIIFFVSLSFIINTYIPTLKNRMNNFVQGLTSKTDEKTSNSTAMRLLIWKSSNQIIIKNPLTGVGIGDVKDALKQEYKKRGIENALAQNFNAHNQYYQIFIALGALGFLLLIICLIYPMLHFFKFRIYLFFLMIIIINFLFESMLERQAGVLFYSFFNSLFCFGYLKNNSQNNS